MGDNENTKPQYNEVSGLWNAKGKVAYSGRVGDESITIPSGSKILVFPNEGATPENRRPVYRIVFVTEMAE